MSVSAFQGEVEQLERWFTIGLDDIYKSFPLTDLKSLFNIVKDIHLKYISRLTISKGPPSPSNSLPNIRIVMNLFL